MRTKRALIVLLLVLAPHVAKAQYTLQEVGAFIKDFCSNPPLNSSSTTTELSTDAKAKLGQFFDKYVDVGIGGKATQTRKETFNVLQDDLKIALKNGDDCRLATLKEIKDKIGPPKKVDGRRDDIRFVGEFFDGHTCYRREEMIGCDSVIFPDDGIEVTSEREHSEYKDIVTYRAKSMDLSELVGVSKAPDLIIDCLSGKCVSVEKREVNAINGTFLSNVTGEVTKYSAHEIRIGLSVRQITGDLKGQTLPLERAFSRLISPDQDDRKVCLRATDFPQLRQCPGYHVWQAYEMRRNGESPY